MYLRIASVNVRTCIEGAAIQWLRDNLQIINGVGDSMSIAEAVECTGEVYFVPAFSGLYAPYWRKDARRYRPCITYTYVSTYICTCYSVVCGLTEETKPGHLVRAALESVCYQIRDILEAMTLDCGYPLTKLLVDGGMTANDLLMQLQADLCGIPVGR